MTYSLCGGPLPATNRTNIKYCSVPCRTKAHYEGQKDNPNRKRLMREYNQTRRKTRYLGINCHRRAVMVVDDQMATPYYISKNEFAMYKQDYAKLDGVTVFADGIQIA